MTDTNDSSSDPGGDFPASDSAHTTDGQYGAFTTDDGDTIVYDRRNSAAWIQSDYAIELGTDRSSA